MSDTKGGMDKGNLMLSRKPIGTGSWRTIEFPETLGGLSRNPPVADSHNTAAVGICEADGTIHLLYDMHVHEAHYRVSVKEAAFVPDEEWTLDLFYPQRNYLKQGQNYKDMTYPKFAGTKDGELLAYWRYGFSSGGDATYARYNGHSWSNNVRVINGRTKDMSDRFGPYVNMGYLHGAMHFGFSIRLRNKVIYPHNNGLYYLYAKEPVGVYDWRNIYGDFISLPVRNLETVKIGEPGELGAGDNITTAPDWTVTENGAVHFITRVNSTNVHYYKAPGEDTIHHAIKTPRGSLYSIGETIVMVELSSGRPRIQICPEGTNDWSVIYKEHSGRKFRHGKTLLASDTLVMFLMEEKSGDRQPLYVKSYLIEVVNPRKRVIRK